MLNRKRIGAFLLCAGMILTFLLSVAFIIHEADHDCSGEDCQVCRTISANINLLRLLGWAVLLLVALMFLHGNRAARRMFRFLPYVCGTLVSLKIRMND